MPVTESIQGQFVIAAPNNHSFMAEEESQLSMVLRKNITGIELDDLGAYSLSTTVKLNPDKDAISALIDRMQAQVREDVSIIFVNLNDPYNPELITGWRAHTRAEEELFMLFVCRRIDSMINSLIDPTSVSFTY